MKTLISYLIFVILIWGCNSPVKDRIIDYIEQNCKNFDKVDDCIFSLEDVTGFEWDKVYVFRGPYYQEDISKIIGFECNCGMVSDDYRRLLFIKDKKIVHIDDFYYFSDKEIQFRELDWENEQFPNYTPSTAKFYVLKRYKDSDKQDYFYDLYPIGGTLQPEY